MTATPGLWPTPGCLDNIRVLELGDEKGEYCGRLLSGEGADLIKIEPPGGNSTRRIGPFYQDVPDRDRSLFFWMYNRGKRGITLDLSRDEGRRLYLDLAKEADVILDAQGLGAMAKLGLGYERLQEIKPDLIYCCITPFGLTGPWREFKTSDLIHMALGGSAWCTGYNPVEPLPEGRTAAIAGDAPRWDTPPMMPQSWHAYGISGAHAAIAVAAAVLYHQATGQGQFIDVSIHDACAQSTEATVPRYIYYKSEALRRSPSQLRCSDGLYVQFGLNRPANLAHLAEILTEAGMGEELGEPKRFADPTYTSDREVMAQLNRLLRRWAETQPARAVFHALQSCRAGSATMYPPENVIDDPQAIDREDFVEIEHPELGNTFIYPRHPRRQTETPWRWGPRAPLVGEHNDEVYGDILGMARGEIDRHKDAGVF